MLLKTSQLMTVYGWTRNEFYRLIRETDIPIFRDDTGHFKGKKSEIDAWLKRTGNKTVHGASEHPDSQPTQNT